LAHSRKTSARALRGLALFLSFFVTTAVSAQREYVVGTTVNLSAGSSNAPQGSTPQTDGSPYAPFYGLSPSLTLTSAGTRSSLRANYAFGLDRTDSSTPIQNQSHSASLSYSASLGPLWTVGVTNSFTRTADLRTFNALRGVTPDEDPTLVFSPVGSRTSSRDNSFSWNAMRVLDSDAAISFQASHSIRLYGADGSPVVTGLLSNQQQFSGGLMYAQRVASEDEFTFGYSGSYLDFTDFHDAIAHAAKIGYAMQFPREVTLQLGAGVSRVISIGLPNRYTGYDATASLQKTVESTTFSFRYNQNSAQPSGLGSTSRTRGVSLGLNRAFGKVATTFVDISGFESKGTLDNRQDSRGVSVMANVGFPITSKLSVQGGAHFQRQRGSTEFDFVQKRLFFSLSFTEPRLWRFR
jgi:hypothetical protein